LTGDCGDRATGPAERGEIATADLPRAVLTTPTNRMLHEIFSSHPSSTFTALVGDGLLRLVGFSRGT